MIGALDDFSFELGQDFRQRFGMPAPDSRRRRTASSAKDASEQGGHQQHTAVAILEIGGMHDGVHQQACVSTRICRNLLIFLPAS